MKNVTCKLFLLFQAIEPVKFKLSVSWHTKLILFHWLRCDHYATVSQLTTSPNLMNSEWFSTAVLIISIQNEQHFLLAAVFNTAQTSGQSQTSRNLMNSKRENFLRISFLPFAKFTATFWVKVGFPIPGLPYTRIRLRMGWSSSPSNTSLLSPSFFFVFPSGFLCVKTLTVCKCH